jgi:long-chain acyl-CoA synthetase
MNAPLPKPPTIEGFATMPTLFRQRLAQMGERTAMREKAFGVWTAISWAEYGRRVRRIGMGLAAHGLARGDVVAILSENNKEWVFTDVAVMCAGGISCGIYPTDSPRQVEYVLSDSHARYLFVENEEQLDKYLAIADRVPAVRRVVLYDTEGLRGFTHEKVVTLETLEAAGEEYDRAHPGEWDQRVDAAQPGDVLLLIYTSGTTGPPKGAMISNSNVIFQLEANQSVVPISAGDEKLCFLPLSHIAERTFAVFRPIGNMSVINFVESPETFAENLREVAPTVMFAVPRIWEKFYSQVTLIMREATALGRWAYRAAVALGARAAAYTLAGKRPPLVLRIASRAAGLLVLDNVKRALGLHRLRWCYTGAAPIAPDLIRWYYALGIRMYELYGQTENTGVATANTTGRNKVGSVGRPEPGTEVRISAEGEILLRGPHVFLGYLNQPERSAETLRDGWLHTGDVGTVDTDGFLRITDRLKDIIITAGGKNITPSEIENQLKFSPFISDAVVIGDRRKYLTALIMIDHDNVAKFAQDRAVPFSNYASLCRAQPVLDLIGNEVAKVNREVARVETVKDFRLIDQLLTAEDEELTATMKLKRKLVNEKYRTLIDSMYASENR